MAAEQLKAADSALTGGDKRLLDREIREMISALTQRLSEVQHVQKLQPGSSHDQTGDGCGISLITLAGSNTGAAMRGELDDKSSPELSESEALGTYVNSNFQAINNSIMLGGSYSTNDPGVHMDVSDYLEQHPGRMMKQQNAGGKIREKKKEKKKETSSSSDEHTG